MYSKKIEKFPLEDAYGEVGPGYVFHLKEVREVLISLIENLIKFT